MAVAEARGVIMLACARAKLPVSEYTPLQVKQSVAAYGQAGKQQVAAMVTRLLKLKETPKPDDVTDALAVAICHSGSRRVKSGLS
jgi:crossover junction endodeoxyribonuclease RuvC